MPHFQESDVAMPEKYVSHLYKKGALNALTDVKGVRVGHITLIEGDDIRTGATAIFPHGDNIFQNKVPAGFSPFNGFGKFAGSVQVEELGELETPILLTNTLATGRAIEALNRFTIKQQGNSHVTSINAVVGETNDSRLNNIRLARPTLEEMELALNRATTGAFAEGGVGAGTGTVAFGLKGGIGTSSRLVDVMGHSYTIGVLVQSNFGGHLRFNNGPAILSSGKTADKDGSIIMIVATDAPLCARQLKRLANRTVGGLARTGAALSNGSGDFGLAFSTHELMRIRVSETPQLQNIPHIQDSELSPFFEAVIEATEESILRSLWMAETTTGIDAKTMQPSCFYSLQSMLE